MSNSSFPWFPFYARDWLTDSKVLAMSCCQRGAFIHLLALQWENGGLPNDYGQLAKMTGWEGEGLELEAVLQDCFVVGGDDGLLRNERLMELRAEKLAKRAAQSAGARSTLAKRQANRPVRASEKTDADADAEKSKTSVRKRTGAQEYDPNFELFWNAYPKRSGKRVGKKATYRRWRPLFAEQDQVFVAAKNYAQSKIARVDGKARDPERFLKDDYWRDWLDGPGTDVHVEERDKPRPAAQTPQGGPAVDPSVVTDELGAGSLREAVRGVGRALSMDEKIKSGDLSEPVEGGDAVEEV